MSIIKIFRNYLELNRHKRVFVTYEKAEHRYLTQMWVGELENEYRRIKWVWHRNDEDM